MRYGLIASVIADRKSGMRRTPAVILWTFDIRLNIIMKPGIHHLAAFMMKRVFRAVSSFPIPVELRIPALLDVEELVSIRAKLTELGRQMVRLRNAAGTMQAGELVLADEDNALAKIATNAWRLKSKMVDPETGETRDEMKRGYRYLEGICESLGDIGVETIDETGRAYDSGMALKVIGFDETAGLSREVIKETVKPTVRRQGRRVQMGEIIVGTPGSGSSDKGGVYEQSNN